MPKTKDSTTPATKLRRMLACFPDSERGERFHADLEDVLTSAEFASPETINLCWRRAQAVVDDHTADWPPSPLDWQQALVDVWTEGEDTSTPEIPEGLKEALRWAEKLQGISIETGGTLVFKGDEPDDIEYDHCWEWIDRLVTARLQLARDWAAGRKKACRFAAAIDGHGDYCVSGWSDEDGDLSDGADGVADNLERGEARSFGTVYLTLPVDEEVEAET